MLNPEDLFYVSIPSNGSIQFLQKKGMFLSSDTKESLNPLKRVNSILTVLYGKNYQIVLISLNPLKRVNSILTIGLRSDGTEIVCLNPLKRVNSILTQFSRLASTKV